MAIGEKACCEYGVMAVDGVVKSIRPTMEEVGTRILRDTQAEWIRQDQTDAFEHATAVLSTVQQQHHLSLQNSTFPLAPVVLGQCCTT
jgi:hypothetical protein